jgi:hypothetical protein
MVINMFCRNTIKYVFNVNVKRNNDIMRDRLKMKILLIEDNREITDAVIFYLESLNIPCTVTNEGGKDSERLKKVRILTLFF